MADNTDLRPNLARNANGRQNNDTFNDQIDAVTESDGAGGWRLKTGITVRSPSPALQFVEMTSGIITNINGFILGAMGLDGLTRNPTQFDTTNSLLPTEVARCTVGVTIGRLNLAPVTTRDAQTYTALTRGFKTDFNGWIFYYDI